MSLLHAQDGRLLGPRATETRTALLAAAAKHLESTPWHRASVSAVTEICGTSTATFYQYFPDVASAIRELVADVSLAVPEHVLQIAELLAWEDLHLGAVDAA